MNDDPFERAVQRAEGATQRHARRQQRWSSGNRKAFRVHATVYVAVQLLLVVVWAQVWATSGEHFPWFIYPLLGWGIGLAAHYAAVHDHLHRS